MVKFINDHFKALSLPVALVVLTFVCFTFALVAAVTALKLLNRTFPDNLILVVGISSVIASTPLILRQCRRSDSFKIRANGCRRPRMNWQRAWRNSTGPMANWMRRARNRPRLAHRRIADRHHGRNAAHRQHRRRGHDRDLAGRCVRDNHQGGAKSGQRSRLNSCYTNDFIAEPMPSSVSGNMRFSVISRIIWIEWVYRQWVSGTGFSQT